MLDEKILDQIRENSEYPLTDIQIKFQEKIFEIKMIYQTKNDKTILTLDFERLKNDTVKELLDTLRQILTVNQK